MVAWLAWSDAKVRVCSAGKGFAVDLMQVVRRLGQGDVVLEIRSLQFQLIRLDKEALNHAGDLAQHDELPRCLLPVLHDTSAVTSACHSCG